MDAPHKQLAAELRARIDDGTYPPGTRFPSHRRISTEHGLGVGAAYQAVAVLRKEGLLEGRPGARLTVAYRPGVRSLYDVDFNPDRKPGQHPPPFRLGDRERGTVRPSPDLRARLQVPAQARLSWERTELLDPDGRPALLLTTWQRGAAPLDYARVVWELQPHSMTGDEAAALGLVAGTAALLVERTRLDGASVPVQVADLVLPADRWRVSWAAEPTGR